jgi:Uma2 family endonuclease
MATATLGAEPATTTRPRRRFTVAEYYRMAESGILRPDERVELIAGEIVAMSPIGSPHASCVKRAVALFSARLAGRATLSIQDPVLLDDQSEPEPDVALLRPRADFYKSAHPGPADVLLLIEVMDTSAPFDRGVKLPLYARAGIPEVWLLDLNGDRIEAHRRPVNGVYTEVQIRLRGQRLAPGAFPDIEVGVDEILG